MIIDRDKLLHRITIMLKQAEEKAQKASGESKILLVFLIQDFNLLYKEIGRKAQRLEVEKLQDEFRYNRNTLQFHNLAMVLDYVLKGGGPIV